MNWKYDEPCEFWQAEQNGLFAEVMNAGNAQFTWAVYVSGVAKSEHAAKLAATNALNALGKKA
jgi:hypothetical protein